jgi:hypothetical protein
MKNYSDFAWYLGFATGWPILSTIHLSIMVYGGCVVAESVMSGLYRIAKLILSKNGKTNE